MKPTIRGRRRRAGFRRPRPQHESDASQTDRLRLLSPPSKLLPLPMQRACNPFPPTDSPRKQHIAALIGPAFGPREVRA